LEINKHLDEDLGIVSMGLKAMN